MIVKLHLVHSSTTVTRQVLPTRKGPLTLVELETEIVGRTNHLKIENDNLRGRIEVLERCLNLITRNLSRASEILQTNSNNNNSNGRVEVTEPGK